MGKWIRELYGEICAEGKEIVQWASGLRQSRVDVPCKGSVPSPSARDASPHSSAEVAGQPKAPVPSLSAKAGGQSKVPMPPPPVKADTPKMQCLADACGQGDADAMLELSEYLHQTRPAAAQAVNMWLLRAAIYGNHTAQGRVQEEIKRNPRFLGESIIPYENFLPDKRSNWYSGSYPGYLLNAVGLLVFQPGERYLLAGIDGHRAMVVWQERDYDPPDADGFGAENYYDMYCLDEFFQLIPGVPMVRNVSSRDIRYLDGPKERYRDMTHAMVEAVGKREKIPLWTEFVK